MASGGHAETLSLSRGSTEKLSEQLAELFSSVCEPGHSTILFRSLPDVIKRFEEEKGLKLLEPEEMELLVQAGSNEVLGDNELTVDDATNILTEFFAQAHKDGAAHLSPPSPRSLRSSASERSVKEAAELSGHGSLASPISIAASPPSPVTAMRIANIPRSASDQSGLRMPASPGTPSKIPVSIPKSATTSSLHEKGRTSSPLAFLERTSPLSGFTSPELARPSSSRAAKAKKARGESTDRGMSSREGTPEPSSGPTSPLQYRMPHSRSISTDVSPQYARRKSSMDTVAWSPPSAEDMASPGLDQSSFHAYPISPPATIDAPQPILAESQSSLQSLDMSRDGSQIMRETMGDNSGNGLDFFRNSVASLDGMQSDQVTQLLRDAGEMARKVKESEERYARLQEDYEAQVLEMQARLDEASSELATKRKDEKEARLRREQQLSTIRDHEKDIARLEGAIAQEKELLMDAKRRVEGQMEENTKLTEELQLKEQTLLEVESELRHQKAEHEQLQREYQVAETRVNQLQDDLEMASKVHDELQTQRETNDGLNEELQRVRSELEAASARLQPASRGGSDHGSIGRSLSREIQRRLAALEEADSASSSGETEEAVGQHRNLSHESSSISICGDIMSHVQRKRDRVRNPTEAGETSDVSTQTAEAQEQAASLQRDQPPPYSLPSGPFAIFVERLPGGLRALNSWSPLLASVVETTSGFVFYTAAIGLLGVLVGVICLPSRRPDPYWMLQGAYHAEAFQPAGGALKQRMFYWLNELIWRGLDRSRRVPV